MELQLFATTFPKVAAQILYSRALARTWAQNEKKEGSLVESVVRYLHSFLTGGGGFRRRELEVVANPKQFRNQNGLWGQY